MSGCKTNLRWLSREQRCQTLTASTREVGTQLNEPYFTKTPERPERECFERLSGYRGVEWPFKTRNTLTKRPKAEPALKRIVLTFSELWRKEKLL